MPMDASSSSTAGSNTVSSAASIAAGAGLGWGGASMPCSATSPSMSSSFVVETGLAMKPQAPASWQAVTMQNVEDDIVFNRLPPDNGVVTPIATSDQQPDQDVTADLDTLVATLPDWSPGKIADPVQRVRNLLYVPSVIDVFQLPSEPYVPLIVFDVSFRENERRMMVDAARQGAAMLKAAGLVNVGSREDEHVPGDAIHEMGGAVMGDDPAQSVVNRWSQAHDAPNLFVTDGAQMASTNCVNPSLTYMALTARAADRAVKLIKAGAL